MPFQHPVGRGDCIVSIAFDNGFHPDTLWHHPENAELKALRHDPHVLLEGDAVFVPDKRPRNEPAATGARHVFRRHGVPKLLKIRLMRGHLPVTNLGFTICIDDGAEARCKTDGDGWLRHPIAPNAKTARVRLDGSQAAYHLQLGGLDPVDTPPGVVKRLQDLGLYDGPMTEDAQDPSVVSVLKALQQAHDLAPTGQADGPTQQLLRSLVGG